MRPLQRSVKQQRQLANLSPDSCHHREALPVGRSSRPRSIWSDYPATALVNAKWWPHRAPDAEHA
jgi:hypothetical protein